MDKVLDIFDGWLAKAVSSGVLEITQVLIFISIVSVLALVVWKIRSIAKLFHDVRNSKINEYQRLLSSYNLPDADRDCINNEIQRIIRFRTSGISDIARQKIVWLLLAKNKDLIAVDFFKRFRSFLEIDEGVLVFKKGTSFWVENTFYFIYSLQFFLFSISLVVLSVYRGSQIPLLMHIILYSMAAIMFILFGLFASTIIRKNECVLLIEILNTQHDIAE